MNVSDIFMALSLNYQRKIRLHFFTHANGRIDTTCVKCDVMLWVVVSTQIMSDIYFDLKKYIEVFAFFEMFKLLSQTIQIW